MQLKKGFTLVEVLIALAILGIVAATTIYILINIIPKEHEYLAKKPAVTLSYGVKTLLENDKIYPNKAFEGGEKFCDNYVKIFSDIGSTNCEQPSNISDNKFFSGDKLPDNIYALTNLTTSTGETWIGLNQKFKDEKTPIKIIVDVNGPNKGNNILGEDVVLLSLYQNGKIGEYEASDSTTDQKTHKYVDCSKCKLVKTPVENSCSAAYKGKIKLVCEPYPQCSRDGGPYACCAYILNHYWEYPWGNWNKSTRSRQIIDDLGEICTQTCDSLVKKEAQKTISCNNNQKSQYCNMYYLPYSPFSIQSFISNGQEIQECRNNCQEYPCCAYITDKKRLKDYWASASWNKDTREGSLEITTDPKGTQTVCKLSCSSLVSVKQKDPSKTYDDGSPAAYIEEYYLPNEDGSPSSIKISQCEKEKDVYKAKFINIYTIGDGGFSDPNCTKYFGKNGTNTLYKRLKKCEETCGLKKDANGQYYTKGASCCNATFRVNINEFTFYKLNENNQLVEVTNIDKNKYIITNCSIPENSWACPVNYQSKNQIGTPGTLNKETPKGSPSTASCKIINNGKALEIFVQAGADMRSDGKPHNYDDWAMTGLNIEIQEQ